MDRRIGADGELAFFKRLGFREKLQRLVLRLEEALGDREQPAAQRG